MGVLIDNYNLAKQWGVAISYSAYTPLRTGNADYCISDPAELELLKNTMDKLVQLKGRNGRITNSVWTLTGTYDFFKSGNIAGCKAGQRFLVVNPDGTLRPCSMYEDSYTSTKEIKEKYDRTKECGACYVSIRAYLDASYGTLLIDNVRQRVFSKNGKNGNNC